MEILIFYVRLILLICPPGHTTGPTPLSRIPPEQHRSGKCPTNSGTTPANHGQPGGLRQVLPVPEGGIANAGL